MLNTGTLRTQRLVRTLNPEPKIKDPKIFKWDAVHGILNLEVTTLDLKISK